MKKALTSCAWFLDLVPGLQRSLPSFQMLFEFVAFYSAAKSAATEDPSLIFIKDISEALWSL